MPSFAEINKAWSKVLHDFAFIPLRGKKGRPYPSMSERSQRILAALWEARQDSLPDVGAMIEAGKTVRFWADPHFGHGDVIKKTGRPYASAETMDAALWAAIEHAMAETDLLVCLGDLAMRNSIDIQRRLSGVYGDRQITVVGNHDARDSDPEEWATLGAAASLAFSLPLDLLRTWFEEDHAEEAGSISWSALPERISFGCSHWVVYPPRLPGPEWVNIHGHIHQWPAGSLRINCSVETIGYAPKTVRELLSAKLFADLEKRQRGLEGFEDAASATVS